MPENARVTGGEIIFAGRDLTRLPEREFRGVRGSAIGIVFQDPKTSLNPILTVGGRLREAMIVQLGLSRADAELRAEEPLALVRIPCPRQTLRAYPHELSAGMRERRMIAIALCCDPKLLIGQPGRLRLRSRTD